MYAVALGKAVSKHINARTIAVDLQMCLLQNLGSVSNTIIYEYVH